MSFDTADLCDRFGQSDSFQVAEPVLRHFGGSRRFCGQITTLKVFEDNSLVRATLAEKVDGRVLVVDGGGSKRCALIGDTLAGLALENGWQGIVVYGSIRGSELIRQLPIGVMALNTNPLRSNKHGHGDRDVMITFAGVNFKKDHYLYADGDGIIVADAKLD
ncbi:ribonuclease E activity regulator RraA [Methylomonas koyamae]|uniref:4-hydroxy-4-methyl-2-oxoglutarate aldolase n=1 Tax=Methylomonas koyamae TaxID=702114 RepID=A0A291ILZ8_9GAMM|nr:ribonuclease E activity regulator RraA [Methylomonas koyamae]ATG91303.1 ribonuclease [Methylomonas koyamae]OAI21707.1 ribonuclease [Methylomonas koyamae]BBL57700.1 putative 4-hydroxy-4-methyl-2-oxoglutarate aldolase [Methylomonas koyamae]